MKEPRQFDMTILYVEDEAPAREEIETLLRRRARQVVAAENGAQGLELFKRLRPDVVITDLRMPVMDGLRLAQQIKALDPEAAVIVTSAHSDAPSLIEAIETGVDHYVLKPIEAGRLLAALAKCADVIDYRKAAERHRREREQLIAELKDALLKVKVLRGLLPICCSCKKIKDDKGYWNQVENYISEHSDAEFSHSLCPDCARRLYPDYYKE